MPLRKHPPHPGSLLRAEIEELGFSVADVAEGLGITRQALYNVLNGKSSITPEMAVRLEKGLGDTAESWLNLQMAYDLSLARSWTALIRIKRLVSNRKGDGSTARGMTMSDEKQTIDFGDITPEQLNEARHYRVEVHWSPEDLVFIAEVPELNEAKTHADTPAEAVEMAHEMAALWLSTARHMGWAIPAPFPGVETPG